MKNMTKRMYECLRPGLQACGRSMDAYYYVEENLRCDEADTIYEFCKWMVDNDIGCGPANIDQRIREFRLYLKDNPPQVRDEDFDLPEGGEVVEVGNLKVTVFSL